MRLGTPIDYLSSRGGRFPNDNPKNAGQPNTSQLGIHPRLTALMVVALGFFTFFLPLVTVDPPVLDTTHWSAFNIVRQMYKGNLHAPACERCREPLVRALVALPFLVTLTYVLMAAALLPLSVRYAMNTVAAISGVGVVGGLYLRGRATAQAFEDTFYGHWSTVRHVHYGSLQLALLGVMVALFLITGMRGQSSPGGASRR